jgi:hypothetical protein
MQVSRQEVATMYGRAEWIAMHFIIMMVYRVTFGLTKQRVLQQWVQRC